MPLSRSMASVASGVEEFRVRDRSGEYRLLYYTDLADSVLIVHVFAKKTQKTPPKRPAISRLGNSSELKRIERFCRKDLDTIAIDTLYKTIRAMIVRAARGRNFQ